MSKNSVLLLALGAALGAGITASALHVLRPARPEGSAGTTATVSADVAADRLREILKGTDPLERVTQVGEFLPSVDPAAAPAIAEVFQTSQLDSGDPELILFGIWWAEHDPEAAYAWTTVDWRARNANVIAAVVRIWAHSDPQSALAAARGLSFEHQREIATDAAVLGWDESGRPGLLESLSQMNLIQTQQIGETIARARVIALGPEAALRWADALPEGDIRNMLSVRVASAAALDKQGAPIVAEWARPRVREGKGLTSNYPRRIATRWVQHDPDATWAWLASLPAGDDRDDGVGEAYRTWLRRDPPAAHAWMEKTGIQSWSEPAVSIYARALAWQRPKEAIELARRLTDETWRESTTSAVAQNWMTVDSEAAKAWLAQADLPEKTRHDVMATRDANPRNQEQMDRFLRGNPAPPEADE